MHTQPLAIIIGRQFGSGGRYIGQLLARRLGFPYYDRQLICEAAKEIDCIPELYNELDERKPSLFRSFLPLNLGAYFADSPSCSRAERLYQAEASAIRRIASAGGCVILGRTADYILRDSPGMISIFLSADIGFREKRIMEAAPGLSPRRARELASRHDRRRKEFYEFFTGRLWGDAANYHLCIDTSRAGLDAAADMIMAYIGLRCGKP